MYERIFKANMLCININIFQIIFAIHRANFNLS